MTMLMEEVALYLTAQGICRYSPDDDTGDTYLGIMPADNPDVIGIYLRGGDENSLNTDDQNADVQFIIRNRGKVVGMQKGQEIISKLHGLHSIRLIDGGVYVIDCIVTTGQPIDIGKDAAGNYEWSINIKINYAK